MWRKLKLLILLTALLLIYTGIDLYVPIQNNIRQFNPQELARLDTEMWRSYYDRRQVVLFRQLTQLLRTQYHAPFLRSHVMAYHAAKAAFLFKEGHNRPDYEQALPHLIKFYTLIRQMSEDPFDAQQAARLELEWWIIHRQRKQFSQEQLVGALARAGAVLYRLPDENMQEYAKLRAAAMHIRDMRAAEGNLTERHWQQIQQLLNLSWQACWLAVHAEEKT